VTNDTPKPGFQQAEREILITRVYDAPRELVWTFQMSELQCC